jgi:hypothetical protein
VGPGEYAQPQALEHVRIGPEKLKAKEGFYELRVCEPMEEVAYVDRLELIAVDHPSGVEVYPDERLVITGPPATQRLLCPAEPIHAVRAFGPEGEIDVERLKEADRVYAYQPKLDRRFIGFCEEHSLILEFDDRVGDLESDRSVYLFLTGWIEYPYSQTTYAAAQAGVDWRPMKVERRVAEGPWEVIVADAGAPGGMNRTIAVDLTAKLAGRAGESVVDAGGNRAVACTLRITTNLEIYIDQAFLAADRGTGGFVFHRMPPAGADLHRLGFPLEFSPDGQHPTVYTYDVIEPTSSFKMPAGAYTRYGPVGELLQGFDDQYVILGTGDEIAVRFDGRSLPTIREGSARTFILVSHAYCKDMDLYTAFPDMVEPLPCRGMSAFPYSRSEQCLQDETSKNYRARFNMRSVE